MHVIAALEEAGHEAFVCGGCLRDALLGRTPADWDVTTSARPRQVRSAAEQNGARSIKVVDTGLKHGTVTVVVDETPVEVTTYRIDGEYSDGRRPDRVTFTGDIVEDLARRDFTMNAMAYGRRNSEAFVLIDPFGGRDDLAKGIIRCVGDPELRFREDGLRILRALRFAAVYGFEIEGETARAAKALAEGLSGISRERTTKEFSSFLMGDRADRALDKYGDILDSAMGMQIERQVPLSVLPAQLSVRMAALSSLDFPKLALDNRTTKEIKEIREAIAEMDQLIPVEMINGDSENSGGCGQSIAADNIRISLKMLLFHHGEEAVRAAAAMRRAAEEDLTDVLEEIIGNRECYSLRRLAVNGDDIRELFQRATKELDVTGSCPRNLTGPRIGQVLRELLEAVICGKVKNNEEDLLKYLTDRKDI